MASCLGAVEETAIRRRRNRRDMTIKRQTMGWSFGSKFTSEQAEALALAVTRGLEKRTPKLESQFTKKVTKASESEGNE